uniref:NADH-ubiquinone oxidoreductase chain 5 n=1 Tax=Necremnus tutae TaxID=1615824 RepID=A0A7U3NJA3_9HYME|nr:NADH dehydrogenase subunit 5 [Necremnus tutae]QOV03005.1 NADH dehydrogenase subunit 5 [Necremnus tutae]
MMNIMLYYLCGIIFLLLSIIMFFFSIFFLMNMNNYFLEWMLFSMNSLSMNMFIYIDWITLMFIFTVLLISSMIMFYCIEYMNHDNYNIRFFYVLLFFVFSMLIMVLSPNLISILLGWDGLGLTSYCLVIYYQNYSSYNSGMLTVLLNRIGDIMIIFSVGMMFILGSWSFILYNNMMFIILMMIMIAAFTKSAQFPFSSWLPAAMAAPTPVSSLVHSSTLVTAGVYLMIRFNKLMYNFPSLLKWIMITGLLTMMMAGFSANFEFDMKKIIAFSTLSQLGLMMMIYSMKNYELAFFHLMIHAMFKSMMFMCSGILIHSLNNYQDIRFMGMSIKNFPITTSMFLISNLSLCGMPFYSGFYSKDMILENMFMKNISFILYILLLLSTGLTVMYSIRLSYYLVVNKMMFFPMNNIKEFKLMNYSMLILMFLSIFFGYIMNWMLFFNIENILLLKIEKLMILMVCFTFFFLGKFMYKFKFFIKKNYFIKFFFGKMWFLYNFNYIILINPYIFMKKYLVLYDKGWSEYYFKNSMMMFNKNLNNLNKLNNNILMMLKFIMMYLFLLLLLFF